MHANSFCTCVHLYNINFAADRQIKNLLTHGSINNKYMGKRMHKVHVVMTLRWD